MQIELRKKIFKNKKNSRSSGQAAKQATNRKWPILKWAIYRTVMMIIIIIKYHTELMW